MSHWIVITFEDMALSSFVLPFILKERFVSTQHKYIPVEDSSVFLPAQGGCKVTPGLHIHTQTRWNWESLGTSLPQNLRGAQIPVGSASQQL